MRRDLIALPDDSKVWIYQSATTIEESVADKIKSDLYDFSMQWMSHGQSVDAYAQLFHKKFLVFVADESQHVSGCSIDSSVRFIQQLGQQNQLDFFDRLHFSYLEDDQIKQIHSSKFADAYKSGEITDETLMFDNLVNIKSTFIDRWVVPLKDSWYTRYLVK